MSPESLRLSRTPPRVQSPEPEAPVRHDFQPFGEELAPQNPPTDRKLFTGQERDFETGLDYFYARQLRTDLGRFTAPDPMTDLAWTNPTVGATNAYGYVMNNPLGLVDPSGAQCQNGDKGLEELCHPAYWQKDQYMVWGPSGYYCANCFMMVEQVGANTVQQSTVAQPLTPMGAGVLSFYPGRGPVAGPGVGGAGGGGDGGTSNENALVQCAEHTLKKNGIALALDAASLGVDAIGPEGQYAKMAVGLALSGAATVNSAVHDEEAGAALGMASYLKAPIEAAATREGWGWAKYIPGAGVAMDVYSAYSDLSQAIDDFGKCIGKW